MRKGGPGQIFSPFGLTVLALLAAIGVALWLAYQPWRWEHLKEGLRHRFPDVRHIGTKELAVWIATGGEPRPVLVDVRPQAEYAFSHLPRALHMAVSDTPASLGFPQTTGQAIVVYDATGEDAFPVANSLVKRGYARVQVLEGGIFEWANEGRPLEGAGGETGTVRAGSPKSSRLLNRRATAQ